MVSYGLYPQCKHRAVLLCCQFRLDPEIPAECGARVIIRPVVVPLHRVPRDNRCHRCYNVPGIDVDFSSEPAANVRGNYMDLVLGYLRNHGCHSPNSMWSLCCHPNCELALNRFIVRNASNRLHIRYMYPLVVEAVRDHNICLLEQLVRSIPVAGLPVEHMVRTLVLPDDG